jgi:hypothetical protein
LDYVGVISGRTLHSHILRALELAIASIRHRLNYSDPRK